MGTTISVLRLEQYLKLVLGTSEEIHLTLIREGPANTVYRATCESKSWAIKCLGPDTFSAVNYNNIQFLQQQLAAHGIAPEIIQYDDNQRIWVELWEDQGDVAGTELHRLAMALSRIHDCEIDAPTLALIPCWQHYLEQLPKSIASGFAEQRDALLPVITHENDYNDFCFCHNDLSVDHLVGQERHLVIDWEYAALGNRFFDIAACISINAFSPNQASELCVEYAKLAGLDVDIVQAKVNTFLPVVEFTNRLWSKALEAYQNV